MSDNEPDAIEMENDAASTVGLYWVAAFLVDLGFGGHEDGGWYYWTGNLVVDPDVYQTLGCGPAGFADTTRAKFHASKMRENLSLLNKGRPNITSVLSIGVYEVRIMQAVTLPAHFPATLPRYE